MVELTMATLIDSNSLHRTAKYFMDNGRAKTHGEAMALLEQFGLTVHVGREVSDSAYQQMALLSLVNTARRTLLGGVEVIGLPDVPGASPFASGLSIRAAAQRLGARLVDVARPDWPSALIGEAGSPASALPCWCLTWNGWRGGVIPVRDGRRLPEDHAVELAPILAAACCAAEVFAFHVGDHPMAGRRPAGLSLWQPGSDWLTEDPSEADLSFLPSRLWLIGLGNLGQAFTWALASLPYENRRDVQLILQDFDRITASNDSTSLLSFDSSINLRKARVVADWMEALGFDAYVNERRFGEWTRRGENEPAAALCGVDNALARAALGKAGFGLVVEAGLGAGPEAFRSMSIHTFPASRSPEEIWSRQVAQPDANFENTPAYQALKRSGMDSCGLAQLASRTVGVPFVGLIAACLVVSEILRRLNGGHAYELVSGSAASLSDLDVVPISAEPYAFGHTAARRGDAPRSAPRRMEGTADPPAVQPMSLQSVRMAEKATTERLDNNGSTKHNGPRMLLEQLR
jgi:hypothetical protein